MSPFNAVIEDSGSSPPEEGRYYLYIGKSQCHVTQ